MAIFTILGTKYNDSIDGTALPDLIDAGDGNDTIDASGPSVLVGDTIYGGKGHDHITVGTGFGAEAWGGEGNDTIVSGNGNFEALRGGVGNDVYYGVFTDAVTLIENAGEGIDSVYFKNDWYYDTFTLVANIENLYAMTAADAHLIGNGSANLLVGNAGADTLEGLAGNDTLQGGEGADQLRGGADNDSLDGGAGNDHLWGDSGNDVLAGGAGTDTLEGGSGNDTYVVNDAADIIVEVAGGGVDTVMTNLGGFTLIPEVENLTYTGILNFAGTGNDAGNAIKGGAMADVLEGLGGNDKLFGYGGNDKLYGGDGSDTVDAGAGDDLVFGSAGGDSVLGGDGVDALYGESGNDSLYGGAGNDGLLGGDGNDVLRGEDGDDRLVGGLGADDMAGGAGIDKFVYSTWKDSTATAMDTITGFQHGIDRLDLSAIDADTTVAGNQAFHALAPGMIFASPGDLVIENAGFDSYVRADVNGDGVWDLNIKLALNTGFDITDIIL